MKLCPLIVALSGLSGRALASCIVEVKSFCWIIGEVDVDVLPCVIDGAVSLEVEETGGAAQCTD